MSAKALCKYRCALYSSCTKGANEITTVFDFATREGGNCEDLILKQDSYEVDPFNRTDAGNAIRLVNDHGENIRYCSEMKEWYVFNDCIWDLDTSGQIYQKGKLTAMNILSSALNITEETAKKRWIGHGLKMESQIGLKNMIESAQNEPGIPIFITQFDTNKDYVCVGNGIIDLQSSKLLPFNKKEYITKQISVEYNKDAQCPLFLNFLSEILCHDIEMVNFIKRLFGYALTGYITEQFFIIFQGNGANGKTTLMNTIMSIFGVYAKTTDPETITHQKYGHSSTNDLAALNGARLLSVSENEKGMVIDEGRVKRMTGGEPIPCRFLFKEWFDLHPEFLIILSTNHEPIVQAHDDSIWRRIKKIVFNAKFEDDACDPDLEDKLKDESEGILSWIIEGSKEWYELGLKVPDSVCFETDKYKDELDVVGEFIEQCCILDKDLSVSVGEIYFFYKYWCLYTDNRKTSKRGFSGELRDRGFEGSKINGIRVKIGLDVHSLLKEDYSTYKTSSDDKTLTGSIGSQIDKILEVPREGVNILSPRKTGFCVHASTAISTDDGTQKKNRPQPRLSQEQVSSIVKLIVKEWYGDFTPTLNDIQLSINSISHETLKRCTTAGHDISIKSCKMFVSDYFKVRGWIT